VRTRFFLLAAVFAVLVPALPSASLFAQAPGDRQSDLDAFMKQVLTRRDDNWQKLQQYTLEESEKFQITAMNGRKIYGFTRDYLWYPSDPSTAPAAGNVVFIRSPISADGVKLSEEKRREAEAAWVKQEEKREKRREEREKGRREGGAEKDGKDDAGQFAADSDAPPSLEDLVTPGNEPRFISSAYFMKFKFDEGTYALAGKEELFGRDVYKVEYYPKRLFSDAPRRRAGQKRDLDDKIDEKFDKVSMVTMWIEPAMHQILQYEFTNIDFDFLPARALFRLDDLRASMRMREAFPNVWLPDTIAMRFRVSLAIGDVNARYDVRYGKYKLAEVRTRVR
jgi:hypothetical protein